VINDWFEFISEEPCLISNLAGLGTPQQKEVRLSDHTAVTEDWHISFTRLLLDIDEGMRAIVQRLSDTGVVIQERIYDIMGVDHSSQNEITRLRVEITSA